MVTIIAMYCYLYVLDFEAERQNKNKYYFSILAKKSQIKYILKINWLKIPNQVKIWIKYCG